MNWRETLRFPPECEVSAEAESLIRGLLCEREQRLTLDRIKAHPFFHGIDWPSLRSQRSFFRPRLQSPIDTRYFREQIEQIDEDDAAHQPKRVDVTSLFSQAISTDAGPMDDEDQRNRDWGADLPWIGYTYKAFDAVTHAFNSLDSTTNDNNASNSLNGKESS